MCYKQPHLSTVVKSGLSGPVKVSVRKSGGSGYTPALQGDIYLHIFRGLLLLSGVHSGPYLSLKQDKTCSGKVKAEQI